MQTSPLRLTLLPWLLLALTASAGATLAADKMVGTGPGFKGPVGLQLYSLRAEFIRNVPASLQKVQDMGFTLVELAGTYNLSTASFNQMLKEHHLKAVSGHFPFERYRDDPAGVAKEAKELGLEFAGCAWIPHQGDFDEAQCRNAIAVFNRAGEVLAAHGLKFFYHAHGYEFQPHGSGTLLDLMMTETKPQFVSYEMDVYWVVHPGQDPVALFKKYGSRWSLVHLKDMKKGVKTGILTGKTDVSTNVPLGTGQMNWPAILQAAHAAGVKYYFIEDESAVAADQIPQSLRYLEQLKP